MDHGPLWVRPVDSAAESLVQPAPARAQCTITIPHTTKPSPLEHPPWHSSATPAQSEWWGSQGLSHWRWWWGRIRQSLDWLLHHPLTHDRCQKRFFVVLFRRLQDSSELVAHPRKRDGKMDRIEEWEEDKGKEKRKRKQTNNQFSIIQLFFHYIETISDYKENYPF